MEQTRLIATSTDPRQFRPRTVVQVEGRPFLVLETRPTAGGKIEVLGRPVQV